jgi:DNA-binding PucR family transcriptional regulator
LTPESVAGRLLSRRPELERAVLARVSGVADPASVGDPEYVDGLRTAVGAALGYGIAALSGRGEDPPPVPIELLDQARVAARKGVSLDTVLRRYFAGYTLLGDFLIDEAERSDALSAQELRRALRTESVLFDQLLVAVSAAYGREIEGRHRDGERRRARRVEMLLAGELVDAAALEYELDVWHLAAVAAGPGARAALRELATRLQRRALVVCAGGETIWAWFGGLRPTTSEKVKGVANDGFATEVALALGEPAEGIDGWRRSHRQALAALPVALRGSQRVVRYAEVTLLASALQDDVLASSLNDLYLDPLTRERDGGEALRRTLRAYFDADRQVSATAASLRVSRQTVSARLRLIEKRIGLPLESCAAELETAFQLRELGRSRVFVT